jgi:hypothetical protein
MNSNSSSDDDDVGSGDDDDFNMPSSVPNINSNVKNNDRLNMTSNSRRESGRRESGSGRERGSKRKSGGRREIGGRRESGGKRKSVKRVLTLSDKSPYGVSTSPNKDPKKVRVRG